MHACTPEATPIRTDNKSVCGNVWEGLGNGRQCGDAVEERDHLPLLSGTPRGPPDPRLPAHLLQGMRRGDEAEGQGAEIQVPAMLRDFHHKRLGSAPLVHSC